MFLPDVELAAWLLLLRLAGDVTEGVHRQVFVQVRPEVDHA